MNFSRLKDAIHFDYHMNSYILDKVESIKDLGVIFNNTLIFKEYIDYVFAKSMRSLGFLKRNCVEFNNIITLKTLLFSLVRPHLEYCCIVWNPIFNIDAVQIKKVQKSLTRFMFSKLTVNMDGPSYFVRCKLFGRSLLWCKR